MVSAHSTLQPWIARKANTASNNTATTNAQMSSIASGVAVGSTPATVANGTTSSVTHQINLERGVSISKRHGDLLQNFLDDLADGHAFDFKFRPQHETMFQHRRRHRLHIVRRHEIAARNGGERTAREQQ